MSEKKYDLVVIGGGPGGYVAAIRASQLGLSTALVEYENLGGVCLNWGCIPTKALLKTAEVYRHIKNAEKYGLKVSGVEYDLDKIVGRSRNIAGQLSMGVTGLLKKNKVEVIKGFGRLLGDGRVNVARD
jgi:dihydrolipoamide dehydrogenase